ncbi:hypothetical protein CEXT_506431 [Caerostris extrusa]|uniref:Uncharacterized protein n=1 Tax=Caerostris extrusa TaxID=172846 RepID=A0AAV4QQ57_CAEEX|nr:hypothetical protein CEXT_506431 [Caerostris extrusa]
MSRSYYLSRQLYIGPILSVIFSGQLRIGLILLMVLSIVTSAAYWSYFVVLSIVSSSAYFVNYAINCLISYLLILFVSGLILSHQLPISPILQMVVSRQLPFGSISSVILHLSRQLSIDPVLSMLLLLSRQLP